MNMYRLTKSFVATVYHSSRVVLRTLRATLAEEVELSRARARARYESASAARALREARATTPTLAEAMQILGVDDVGDARAVRARYERLFAANDAAAGGSFYLRSKVVRAMERIDREMAATADADADADDDGERDAGAKRR